MMSEKHSMIEKRSMIEKYNTAQLERERQLQTTTESNPVVQRLTVQIANLKADIKANLATVRRTMDITRAQLKSRTTSFENQIHQVDQNDAKVYLTKEEHDRLYNE